MAGSITSRLAHALTLMQWRRGLRAGAVITSIAVVCGVLHRPLGWACVGGFLSVIVDNGGPYRSRLANVATLLAGGTLACFAGSLGATNLVLSIVVTAVFCFATTLARVLSQPLASVSIAILTCYFASFGSGHLAFTVVLGNVTLFLLGGIWAAALILFLWPVDPFRPARFAVADCYAALTLLAQQLTEEPTSEARRHAHELHSQLRLAIETAQNALSATPARMTSRTIRARNLAVLLQAADLLFARILRISELTEGAANPAASQHRQDLAQWLAASLDAIEPALRERPSDTAASFAAEGSRSIELRRGGRRFETTLEARSRDSAYSTHLANIERDCLLNLEVAFEAVRAIWSGAEPRAGRAATLRASMMRSTTRIPEPWIDALRANWTLRSVMMRHALRLAAVAVVDVLLMRRIHVTHGFWLAMTSIIVLQPYTGQTLRRFAERVGGTVAGGIVAAVFASALPTEASLMAVVVVFAVLSAAVYAVDYGWYCFFLTPTFVLLAMPHLRDWHFALIRMGTTGIGATTAVLGMLLLWRERESLQLPGLLARAARTDAAYLRATLMFWQQAPTAAVRSLAERQVLSPARRACGMAATEAEESLDRALLEPSITLRDRRAHTDRMDHLNQDALTFTTYLRRLTQSITTLAAVSDDAERHEPAVSHFAVRLDALAATLETHAAPPVSTSASPAFDSTKNASLASQQLVRMERQISILEKAAGEIVAA